MANFDITSIEASAAQQYAPEACAVEPASQSVLEDLRRRSARTAAKLADIDAAIKALETNPEILRVLDLMAKANRG